MSILFRFFAVLLLTHISYAVGETEARPGRYIVKINNIPMYSDCAKSIFRHVSQGVENIVRAYDKIAEKDVLLSKTEKNMDIAINNDKFMLTISKLYDSCFGKMDDNIVVVFENVNRKCVYVVENNEEVDLCVDKKSKVLLDLAYRSK